jgi:putative tryptophan/tyrosine transport system substrate-binding protein
MERAMNRRQFVSLLGKAAAMGPAVAPVLMDPSAARAQTSPGRPRRVGLMVATAENDAEGKLRAEVFSRALGEAGWAAGSDVVIDAVWYRGSFPVAQTLAKDLVDRGAEVLVVNGTPGMDAVRGLGAPSTSIPIVFVVVSNPVGAGYVSNLSRPGANITGFSTFEPEIAGKWVQLLREVRPDMQHVSMLLDQKFIGFNSLWEAVRDVAPTLGMVPHAAYASSLAEIERAIEVISKQPSPGLVVSPSPINTVNRQRLIQIANDSGIPAIYPFRFYVREGALIAYGFNAADQFRRAGAYVGRILKGEKAGDLPVQAPSLFELGINLKTAKAMGLTMPQSLLIAADEIVE